MSFNPAKCKTICLFSNKVTSQRKYVFCEVELEQVVSISYLGVILNNKLKWSNHVSSISGKANKVLGLIRRNLLNCLKHVKETAYTAIVQPKLEYAYADWDPYLQKDIDSLERVQRKAAGFCTNGYHPAAIVTDMIQELGWQTLEQRRTFFLVTLIYKMSHGRLDIDVDFYLSRSNESRTSGSHNFKYMQYRATKNAYFYSCFPRTIREWNALPATIVEADSLARFQSGLRDYQDSD